MQNKVKEIREKRGMSQDELSRKSGVSRATISNIECGKSNAAKVDTLIKIADALGKKIGDIFL